jgi:hypothetical protein
MSVVAVAFGIGLVVVALADLMNTLVTTSTSNWRWWPSTLLGYRAFAVLRLATARMAESSRLRERLLSLFAPVLVLTLLAMWTALQVLGFGLIWWGIGGVDGAESFLDALYYSGVVYFTLGFGEVLPSAGPARIGSLVEAFAGVTTTALVIGYLPSLYGAYSAREQKLMILDDGSDDRITPTNLVLAWSPDADTDRLNARFAEWEHWVSSVLETHSTLPLLRLFRSHDRRQNWVTALGLLCDAAVHAQIIVGCTGRTESYWFLRRSIALFEELTRDVDLSGYEHFVVDGSSRDINDSPMFLDLYRRLEEHGFELLPLEEAAERSLAFRNRFAPQLEYLIDTLLCPRGFWAPDLGIELPDDVVAQADLAES